MICADYSAQVTTKVAVDDSNAVVAKFLILLNTTAAPAYVQLFTTTTLANITLGTTVPDKVIPLPASGGLTLQFESSDNPGWWMRGNGLRLAATTGRGNAVTAAVDVMLGYN